MRVKQGISIAGIQAETVVGLFMAVPIVEKHLLAEARMTSGTEAAQGRVIRSLHVVGYAFDLGIAGLTPGDADELRDDLVAAMGDEWDILIRSTHVHVEYQPHWRR